MYLTRAQYVAHFFFRIIPILLAIGVSGNLANSVNTEGRQTNGIECGHAATRQRQPRNISSSIDQNIDCNDNDEDDNDGNDGNDDDDHSSQIVVNGNPFDEPIVTARIFNGKPSNKGSWPWQVSLQLLHPKHGFIGHWCGGVLIEPTWIITAAHCIHNDLFNLPIGALWTAVLGEWQLDSGNRGSVRIPIEKVVLHDRFNNYVHDIALMKLSRAAPLSKIIRTICLPDTDEAEIADSQAGNCVTSGWGRSGPSPSLSNALLEANVPLLRLEDCQKAYGNVVPIGPGHLCAGHTDGSSGSCVGDSGGPLQCQKSDGDWQLAGITSFGSGCARPGFPDVYTRLGYYLEWIKTTIASSSDDLNVN